jgi:hypothetical protein
VAASRAEHMVRGNRLPNASSLIPDRGERISVKVAATIPANISLFAAFPSLRCDNMMFHPSSRFLGTCFTKPEIDFIVKFKSQTVAKT